ncbi:MAG TPA: PAS domain-containing sensor histidine kinase [Longimicrobiales bacterium]
MSDEPLDSPRAVGLALTQRAARVPRNVGLPRDAGGGPDASPAALLDLALKAGDLAQWTWDTGSDRVTWTPRLRMLHGLPEDAVGAPFSDFERSIVPEDRPRVRATLQDAVRTGRETFELEYGVALPGGETRCIVARARVFSGMLDGAARIVALCADATARKEAAARERLLLDENARLREQALRAARVKTGFLAMMSHELRTPLNAIIGYTELWLLGVPAPVPAGMAEHIERVRRCAQHLLRLIEGILTFARIEAGDEELRPERTDVIALAHEAANSIRPLAGERGLTLVLDLPTSPIPIETDGPKVRQILFNLLCNAVKFADRGEVRLGLEKRDGEIRFEVQDRGIGIPPEHLEQIFEPFWQAESARTRRRDGTGLGLSVARRLARMLGGDVTVTSVPGEGSTFRLHLPEALPAGGRAVAGASA